MTSQAPEQALEVRLASRPEGWPTDENFDIVEAPVQSPGDGQILVRNTYMSVDPYMRGRMNDVKSYIAPFQIGKALDGGAVGEVVASNSEKFQPGQPVLHDLGWREYATLKAEHAVALPTDLAPLSTYLGVLGMPGLTAYAGLFHIGQFKEGDVVFVSGAAGAVGSQVGQMAKLRGAGKVIGSAGSPEKVRHLIDDLGFDAAFNYKDGPVREQLDAAAPEGIDLYFDNVGGDHLEAAIGALRDHGRIAACGAISQYNATELPPGPRNMIMFISKRLRMEGFVVIDHMDKQNELIDTVGPWVRDGKLHYQETIFDGLRNAPQAFQGVLKGQNTGKMLVRL